MVDVNIIQRAPLGSPSAAPEKSPANSYVYKAVAQFGGIAEDVFNDINMQRTKAESALYETQKQGELSRGIKQKIDQASNDVNFDWVKNGSKFIESINSDINSFTEKAANEAPSGLARDQLLNTLKSDSNVYMMNADSVRANGITKNFIEVSKNIDEDLNRSMSLLTSADQFDSPVNRSEVLKSKLTDGGLVDYKTHKQNILDSKTNAFQSATGRFAYTGNDIQTIKLVAGDAIAEQIRKNLDSKGKMKQDLAIVSSDPNIFFTQSVSPDGNIITKTVEKKDLSEGTLVIDPSSFKGKSRHIKDMNQDVVRGAFFGAIQNMAKNKATSNYNLEQLIDGLHTRAKNGKGDPTSLMTVIKSGALLDASDGTKTTAIKTLFLNSVSPFLGNSMKKNPNMDIVDRRNLAQSAIKTVGAQLKKSGALELINKGLSSTFDELSMESAVVDEIDRQANEAKAELKNDPNGYTAQYLVGDRYWKSRQNAFASDASGLPRIMTEDISQEDLQNITTGLSKHVALQAQYTDGTNLNLLSVSEEAKLKTAIGRGNITPKQTEFLRRNLVRIAGNENQEKLYAQIGFPTLYLAQTISTDVGNVINATIADKSAPTKFQSKYAESLKESSLDSTIETNASYSAFIEAINKANPAFDASNSIKDGIKQLMYANFDKGMSIEDLTEYAVSQMQGQRQVLDTEDGKGLLMDKRADRILLPKGYTEKEYENFNAVAMDKSAPRLMHITPPASYTRSQEDFYNEVIEKAKWYPSADGTTFKLMIPSSEEGAEKNKLVPVLQTTNTQELAPVEKNINEVRNLVNINKNFLENRGATAFISRLFGKNKTQKVENKLVMARPENALVMDSFDATTAGRYVRAAIHPSIEQGIATLEGANEKIILNGSDDIFKRAVSGKTKKDASGKEIPMRAMGGIIFSEGYKKLLKDNGVEMPTWIQTKDSIPTLVPRDYDQMTQPQKQIWRKGINDFLKKARTVILKDTAENIAKDKALYGIPMQQNQFNGLLDIHYVLGASDYKKAQVGQKFAEAVKSGNMDAFIKHLENFKNDKGNKPFATEIMANNARRLILFSNLSWR